MAVQIREFLLGHKLWFAGGTVAGTLALLGWKLYGRNRFPPLLREGKVDPKKFTKQNHVYLCAPPRLGAIPNISPFCLKLETWLRMENIPYEMVETMAMSSTKQTFPYIYLNGEEVEDSRFIIERCAEHFGKSLDTHLSATERAVSVAYSHLLEEHLVFTLAWHRYTLGAPIFWSNFLPPERLGTLGKFALSMKEFFKAFIKERAWHRGIGRHSPEEIYRIAEEDLESISTYLGSKDFFYGKEPSVIDCTMFGLLAQIFCLESDFPPKTRRLSDWKNLQDYVERIKSRFYPDWNRACNPVQHT